MAEQPMAGPGLHPAMLQHAQPRHTHAPKLRRARDATHLEAAVPCFSAGAAMWPVFRKGCTGAVWSTGGAPKLALAAVGGIRPLLPAGLDLLGVHAAAEPSSSCRLPASSLPAAASTGCRGGWRGRVGRLGGLNKVRSGLVSCAGLPWPSACCGCSGAPALLHCPVAPLGWEGGSRVTGAGREGGGNGLGAKS